MKNHLIFNKKLLEEAQVIGHHKTKKETINAALLEIYSLRTWDCGFCNRKYDRAMGIFKGRSAFLSP